MAPMTRKRKALKQDNEETIDFDSLDNHSEEPGPTAPPARSRVDRSRQLKRPSGREDVKSVAKSGNIVGSKKESKKTQTNILEAKRSVERMADDLKNYIETEMCSSLQTEEPSLLELVVSVEIPGETSNVFPYLSGTSPGKVSMSPLSETYNSALLLLAEYRGAVREYGQLSEGSATAKMPSWLRWDKDSADLQELNTRMLARATSFVEQQVVPSANEVELDLGQDDVEQIAWELLEDAQTQKGAETWGNAAETIIHNMCAIMTLLS